MADDILQQIDQDGNKVLFRAPEIDGKKHPQVILSDPADGAAIKPASQADVQDIRDRLPAAGAASDAGLAAILAELGGKVEPGDLAALATEAKQDAIAALLAAALRVAVRQDADGTPLVADGEPSPLMTDEGGRLKVSTKPATYPDITGDITAIQATIGTPVAGGTVTGDVSRASNVMMFCTGTFNTVSVNFEGSLETTGDDKWFSIQAVRSNANTIETTTGNLSAQPTYAWELSVNALKRVRVRCTARTSGTQSWRFVQGTYATEPIPAAQISGTQPISGTVTANLGTITTPTPLNRNSTADTNLVAVKGSAGSLFAAQAFNAGASVAYLKLYNKATAPVLASDVPIIVLPIPAGGDHMRNWSIPGHRFATGIAMAITGGPSDTDTTAVAAGQVKVALSYI